MNEATDQPVSPAPAAKPARTTMRRGGLALILLVPLFVGASRLINAQNASVPVRQASSAAPASEQAAPTGQGQSPRTQPAPQARAQPAANVSRNWSGYVAEGGAFTSVSGTWTIAQPSLASAGIDATWVGIGGVTSRDLIQAGTEAVVSGAGDAHYDAWIETLPQPSHPVPLAVTGADSVTVTLSEQASGEWLISIRNNTTGKAYAATVRCSSSGSSAEWVEEAPSAGRRVVLLDDFGIVRFTSGSAVEDGVSVSISAASAKPITMADAVGRALASPSVLSADGSSFTVMRSSGSAAGGNGRGPGARNRGSG